jgi:hypothetical protein
MVYNPKALRLKAQLFSEGFLVIPGLVDLEVCTAAAKCIRSKVRRTLDQMQVSAEGHFSNMLTADWMHSPAGWTGPRFGTICLRGWQVGPGTGRSRAPSIPKICDF